MRNTNLILAILTLIVLASAVSAQTPFEAEEAVSTVKVTAQADVIKGGNYQLDYIEAQLKFFPREGINQEVMSLNTGEGEKKQDSIDYRWEEADDEIRIEVSGTVRTSYFFPKINQKIEFPLKSVTDDVKQYVESAPYIDSNDERIIETASKIAEGEDDLYETVFKTARWTKENINYSLNTLTEKISQKSSWVLENKYGVCDEITTLFISLNRALGIPARFVSGMAYSNWNDLNDYGPHAWAEVYIGEWVPFDITYGEFGYVDAGHIKMEESTDASPSSIEYQWRGRNIEVETKPLDIKVEQKAVNGRVSEGISIKAEFIKKTTGFGSYNLLEAEIENPSQYYTAAEVILSRSEDMQIIDDPNRIVLLKPGQTKKLYWTTKAAEDLDPQFIYTIPVLVYTTQNTSARAEFKVMKGYPQYDYEDVESIAVQENTQTLGSQGVSLQCITSKPEYKVDEEIITGCTIKNTGNLYINDLLVCVDKECRKINLGITQQKTVSFSSTETEVGEKEKYIRASNNVISKVESVKYLVYDEPKVKIIDIKHPSEASYDDEFEISFMIQKESYETPKNVKVSFMTGKKKESWLIGELTANRQIVMTVTGKALSPGTNDFTIIAEYEDKESNKYSAEEKFSLDLVNVSVWQRIAIFLRNIF